MHVHPSYNPITHVMSNWKTYFLFLHTLKPITSSSPIIMNDNIIKVFMENHNALTQSRVHSNEILNLCTLVSVPIKLKKPLALLHNILSESL